jgi:quercetin dioxygenase-like cupin family protein
MATQTKSLAAFTLAASQGRTRQPLNILGADVLVKVASADTDGAFAIFSHAVAPMSGPPLHRHSREDEWFYVLSGEITLEIDGTRIALRSGDSAFAPRGTAHTYRNFNDAAAEILVLTMPGVFNEFFEQLSLYCAEHPAPDLADIGRIASRFGIEILGPPLS